MARTANELKAMAGASVAMPNTVINTSSEGIAAFAEQIKDIDLGKTQSAVNADLYDRIAGASGFKPARSLRVDADGSDGWIGYFPEDAKAGEVFTVGAFHNHVSLVHDSFEDELYMDSEDMLLCIKDVENDIIEGCFVLLRANPAKAEDVEDVNRKVDARDDDYNSRFATKEDVAALVGGLRFVGDISAEPVQPGGWHGYTLHDDADNVDYIAKGGIIISNASFSFFGVPLDPGDFIIARKDVPVSLMTIDNDNVSSFFSFVEHNDRFLTNAEFYSYMETYVSAKPNQIYEQAVFYSKYYSHEVRVLTDKALFSVYGSIASIPLTSSDRAKLPQGLNLDVMPESNEFFEIHDGIKFAPAIYYEGSLITDVNIELYNYRGIGRSPSYLSSIQDLGYYAIKEGVGTFYDFHILGPAPADSLETILV
ncbi:MAG: hypothetical protein SPF56_08625 [Bacteroidaceae bacterium]|nr:hypothetical protein [Bacteroidaceae bacterium]